MVRELRQSGVVRKAMVDKLVAEGVYPAISGNGLSAEKMVEYYGADWHVFAGPHHCEKCNADLRGDFPPFKREIGISQNDRCVEYKCPDCGHTWPRS